MQLGWIEGALRYAGRFSGPEKAAYRDLYGVSEASTSRHQARVAEAVEDVCQHRIFERSESGRLRRGGLFVRGNVGMPCEHVFDRVPSMERWLEDALGGSHYGAFEVARSAPDPHTLRVLIRAIQDRHPVRICYQSRSGESDRALSPHVLVKVAGRLHVRGFDHANNDFRDFVLTRILNIRAGTGGTEKFIAGEGDAEWLRHVKLSISDKRDKDGRVREGIRRDYGLNENGHRNCRVRQAIAPYLLDQIKEGFEVPVRIQKSDEKSGE